MLHRAIFVLLVVSIILQIALAVCGVSLEVRAAVALPTAATAVLLALLLLFIHRPR